MEDKKQQKTKLVFSTTTNIRIHDRKVFKKNLDKEKELVNKLKSSHELRKVPDSSSRPHVLLTIQKAQLKPVKSIYDVSAIKNIVNSMDDQLLALIVMNADADRVMKGLKKLIEEPIDKEPE